MADQSATSAAPVSGGESGSGTASADAQRAMALKLIGLLFGAALLVGCSFAVSHLTEWGNRIGMPWVFLGFVLVMMIASQFTVAGASALWQALRPPAPAAAASPAAEQSSRSTPER